MSLENLFFQRITENEAIIKRLFKECKEDFIILANKTIEAIRSGHKILLFGNGGSATQAEHIAGELIGKFYRDRRAIPALALNTNSAIITATANDFSFSEIFARQIEAMGAKGDIALGISTSGNSKNVVEAIKKAKAIGLFTAALSGKKGGALKDLVDVCVIVPADDTPRIQEMHILLGHILCEIIEKVCS